MSGVLGLWSFVCVVVWSGWVWSGLAWSGLVLALTSPFKPGGSPWQLGRRTLHVAHEELLGCWLLVVGLAAWQTEEEKSEIVAVAAVFFSFPSFFSLPVAFCCLMQLSCMPHPPCNLPLAACHLPLRPFHLTFPN